MHFGFALPCPLGNLDMSSSREQAWTTWLYHCSSKFEIPKIFCFIVAFWIQGVWSLYAMLSAPLYTNPLEDGVSPRIPFNSVLLPLPTGPITKHTLPLDNVKVISLTSELLSGFQPKLAFCISKTGESFLGGEGVKSLRPISLVEAPET